jgi:hypothetical protein
MSKNTARSFRLQAGRIRTASYAEAVRISAGSVHPEQLRRVLAHH